MATIPEYFVCKVYSDFFALIYWARSDLAKLVQKSCYMIWLENTIILQRPCHLEKFVLILIFWIKYLWNSFPRHRKPDVPRITTLTYYYNWTKILGQIQGNIPSWKHFKSLSNFLFFSFFLYITINNILKIFLSTVFLLKNTSKNHTFF